MKLLPFKVFNELDREFFRSTLKGNVSLSWPRLKDGVLSQTTRAGHNGEPRNRIELSTVLLKLGHRRYIFAELIHQMIHAYYLQCCGSSDQDSSGTGYDLGHGPAFLALLRCIGQHCEPLRRFLSPDLQDPFLGHQYRLGQRSIHNGLLAKQNAGMSSCYVQHFHANSVDVQDWRNTAVAKTASLQEVEKPGSTSQPGNDKLFPKTVYFVGKDGKEESPRSLDSLEHPREAYIFLRFDDRHYPVLRSSVADLAALTNSPHFKDKALLQLPARTSQEDFLSFALFLIHDTSPPSWKDTLGQVGTSSKGAPAIKSYCATAPKPLLQLVTAFHLEEQLKYKPFQNHILTGLRNLQATAEDPMAVVEKIYDGPSGSTSKVVDPQLREWVRAWLAVDLISSGMGQYERAYKTNLGVLRENEMWSQRLGQLRGKSLAFGEDEKLANDVLCQRFRVGRIRDIPVPFSVQSNLAPADAQWFSQVQQPLGVPNWFASPSNAVGPQWSDNVPHRIGDNGNAFDLAGLGESLPMHHLQGQMNDPSRRICRPEELQVLAALFRQRQQAARDANVPLPLPPGFQPWRMVTGDPACEHRKHRRYQRGNLDIIYGNRGGS
ncbi:MAG: hypothetical protein LQ339_001814 [Xanthoria mediterranea]|nr:MAG: hypothetical protein LQ339_001814 [Xanthoria mediterranea]